MVDSVVDSIRLDQDSGFGENHVWPFVWYYIEGDTDTLLSIQKVNGEETSAYQIGMSRSDIPLTLDDGYEKWCDLLGWIY